MLAATAGPQLDDAKIANLAVGDFHFHHRSNGLRTVTPGRSRIDSLHLIAAKILLDA